MGAKLNRGLLVLCLAGAASYDANATVVTYPAPAGIPMSGDYIVKVGGQNIAVYRGEGEDSRNKNLNLGPRLPRVPYSFAYFDFSGSALVEITSVVRSLRGVRVLPASKGIIPSVNGNTMTFTVTKEYSHLSIEPDRKNGPLLLFANPIELNPPTPSTPGVVYFGPGLHRPAGGIIYLTDNQTLYLAGGAVVQAGVDVHGANVTIRGRGIIDGFPWPFSQSPTGKNRSWGGYPMLWAFDSTNLSIEGIILKDSWRWNSGFRNVTNLTIKNVKIVANRTDSEDGIGLMSSQHVMISDCFIRTDDACITSVVNWVPIPITDVTVTRCSLWTDRANTLAIGMGDYPQFGVAAPPMQTLLYRDIDVLHYTPNGSPTGELAPLYVVGNRDQVLDDVRFENIRINHEGQRLLLMVRPGPNGASKLSNKSPIRNVTFKDIVVTGDFNGSYGSILVDGPDALSPVENVTFDNVVRHGVLALRTSPEVVVQRYTSNIVFTSTQALKGANEFYRSWKLRFERLLLRLWRALIARAHDVKEWQPERRIAERDR